MKKYFILSPSIILLQILFLLSEKTHSQTIYCPEVTAISNYSSICQNGSASLTASIIPALATTSYSVGAITYSPFPYSGGTTVLVNQDDVWSAKFNLPFNFCFAGTSYSQAILGANGVLSFVVSDAGGYESYVINTAHLPTTISSSVSDYCIAMCLRDINPADGGCTIAYYTTGVAPCRAFVAYYKTVEVFGFSCDPADGITASTFQVVLYENTNVIDVYIQNSTNCSASTSSGRGVIGIQKYPAPQIVVTPAGRNGTTFTAVNEAWRFTPTGATSYTVTWASPTGTIGTGLGPIAVSPTVSTTYTATMKVATCSGTATSTYTNVTAISVSGCLPIELLNFNATKKNEDVVLKWTTATEVNNAYFEVERSVDAQTFDKIGYNIMAAGNTTAEKKYVLLDQEPQTGINYYRLKQVDVDGTIKYSEMISIEFEKRFSEISIIPNPALENAILSFKFDDATLLNIDLFDVTGRKISEIIYNAKQGNNQVNLDLSSFSKGLYFLKISNSGEVLHCLKLLKE